MARMDLKQDYRFQGKLFRAGRNVEVPDALAKTLGSGDDGGAGLTPPAAASKGNMPYADLLIPKSFKDEQAVSAASDEQILAVDGIGPARLAEIREYFAG